MYAWMARWLKRRRADVQVAERAFTREPLPDLLVFHQRALPPGRRDAGAADRAAGSRPRKRSWPTPTVESAPRALRALRSASARGAAGVAAPAQRPHGAARRRRRRRRARSCAQPASPSGRSRSRRSTRPPRRRSGTSRPTTAPPPSQRVADIVAALRAHPGGGARGGRRRGAAALLAAAIAPAPIARPRRRAVRYLERRRLSATAVHSRTAPRRRPADGGRLPARRAA